MPSPRPSRRLLILAAAVAYWLFLFIATHTPGSPDPRPPRVPHLDKVQHLVAFAALGAIVCAAASTFATPSWRMYVGVIALIALYAAIDEWTQGLVERRMSDLLDWIADVVGAVLGVILFAAARKWWLRRMAE
jgi:VanZ family protein